MREEYGNIQLMKVYVNDKMIEIPAGGSAIDAVRRYVTVTGEQVGKEIRDAYGNVIASDSPMKEERKIYTR